MKKYLCMLFIFIFSFSLVACRNEVPEDVNLPPVPETIDASVLPPVRVGTEGEMNSDLAESYNFKEAFEAADAVLLLQVREWIAEDNELHKTYYNAKVIHSYKGSAPADIVLLQKGDSQRTVAGYPLFTYGNNLFVFLKKAIGLPYKDAYWIIGSYTSVMDAVQSDDGEVYLIARSIVICEVLLRAGLSVGEEAALPIWQARFDSDPMLKVPPEGQEKVFRLDDVISYVESGRQ